MNGNRMFVVAMLGASLGLAACSDDTGPGTDAGLPDTWTSPDLSVVDLRHPDPDGPESDAPQADGPSADGPSADGPVSDGPSAACDPACASMALSLCVKDSPGMCVECLTTADCVGNPGAFGTICNATRNWCICATDTDCATPGTCTGLAFGAPICT